MADQALGSRSIVASSDKITTPMVFFGSAAQLSRTTGSTKAVDVAQMSLDFDKTSALQQSKA